MLPLPTYGEAWGEVRSAPLTVYQAESIVCPGARPWAFWVVYQRVGTPLRRLPFSHLRSLSRRGRGK